MANQESRPIGRSTLDETVSCPACGSMQIDTVAPVADPVCTECGAVISDEVEHPQILDDSDDGAGEVLSWRDHYTVTNSTEQRVARALEVLEEIAGQINLERSTRKDAAEIYEEAAISNLTDGRSTDLVVAVAIEMAAREARKPRPSGRIAEAANVRVDSLRRLSRRLMRELERSATVSHPAEFLPYLREELDLNPRHEEEARKILALLNETALAGKSPVGFAGAALYLAIDGAITQRKIAQVAGITGETLRVRISEIRSSKAFV